MSKTYPRTYLECLFDKWYRAIPELRSRFAEVLGFATHNNASILAIEEEFSETDSGDPILGFEHGKTTLSRHELAMMSNWRKCKQIYDMDERLYDELSITKDDSIPMDIFDRLPYPEFYVKCPRFESIFHEIPKNPYITGEEIVKTEGFCVAYVDKVLSIRFVSRSWIRDVQGRAVLLKDYFLWGDTYDASRFKTVGELIEASLKGTRMRVAPDGDATDSERLQATQVNSELDRIWNKNGEERDILHASAAVIYIASAEADAVPYYVPRKARAKKDKKATAAEVVRVGYRIGRKLGEERNAYKDAIRNRTGGKVAPHIRKAHWHSYWLGPKKNPTDLVVHWIAPVLVNYDGESVAAVVHKGR